MNGMVADRRSSDQIWAGVLLGKHDVHNLSADAMALSRTMEWIESFLANPHPDLGRTGPVCPFVPMALELRTLWVSVLHPKQLSVECIVESTGRYSRLFRELEPISGRVAQLKTIMLVFPDIDEARAPELIDQAQSQLKPGFISQGLMIGEFHKLNQAPGLHNPAFRPLRSPYPMLAIRHMVFSDLPFLMRDSDPVETRIGFLKAYVERMNGIAEQKSIETAKVELAKLLEVLG